MFAEIDMDSMNELYEGFLEVARTAVPYFKQYTYDHPMVISLETNETMRFLQKAMYKAICHFVDNYEQYSHLMPVSDEVCAILELCKDVPYRAGTYRTDFLIDESRQIQLIEITCRFALNGLLRTGFLNLITDIFLQDKPQIKKIDQYTPIFEALVAYFGAFSHVCLLKNDPFNEGRYLIPLFEHAGYPIHILEFEEIPRKLDLLDNAAVIGQLRQDEWCTLPIAAVEHIIHTNLINDLRTVFLIHDKRFFSVLGNDDFLYSAMSQAEVERFRSHLVPTWGWHERCDLWERAREEKDGWIIKPRDLGMGIGVKAGCLTIEDEWQALFSQSDAVDLILQPFVHQARFNGRVGDELRREDYVVGTLLFFENDFFGPGLFRASSHPVTNQGDDRKIAPLVTPGNTTKLNLDLII